MKKIAFLWIFCISVGANAQLFNRNNDDSKASIGLYPNLSFSDFLSDENKMEYARMVTVEIRPYVSYNLYKNIFIGCNFSYEFFYSNYHKKDNFIELGAFLRYVVPYTIDKKFFRRINLYAEVGVFKTNYRFVSETINTFEYVFDYQTIIIEENFIISNRLNQTKLSFPVGLTFSLTKNLYIDLNWQYNSFINGTNKSGFMCGVGYYVRKKE